MMKLTLMVILVTDVDGNVAEDDVLHFGCLPLVFPAPGLDTTRQGAGHDLEEAMDVDAP